jgi:hypothetical protein
MKILYENKALLFLAIFSTLFFCTSIPLIYNMLKYKYTFSDAGLRLLFYFDEDTEWVKGFSDNQFFKIQKGMSKEQVLHLVGKPLSKYCYKKGCTWTYTWQKKPTNDYDRREVLLDTHGYVVNKRHEFFID